MPKVSYAERHKKRAVPRLERRPLLDEHQVAELLNVSLDTLRHARLGRGELAKLQFTRLPGRLVRYFPEDVEAMIEAGRTSGAPAAE